MFFPKLKAQSRQRLAVEQFPGLDRRPGSGAGCMWDMKNLWSGGYPALEVRPKRSVMASLTKPHGFLGREALVWVDGTALYINGAQTEPVLTDGDKRLVNMGAYLLIWPDKVYINTRDFSDWGSLENTRQTSGEVTFTLCDRDGAALGDYTVRTYAPGEPETGDLWLDTSRPECVMRRYDGSAWLEVENVCTKVSAANIGRGFSAGDGVTLSGCGSSEVNGLHVLQAVGNDWLVVPALCRTLDSQTAVVTVLRTVPDMDFVVEQGNRLWGCKYGIVNGEAVNEIYACKLGDFRNWNSFAGLSTDSYAAGRGSDGPFTGAAVCQGGVVFFKENCMERVYPAAGGGHQIVTVACNGVRKGAGGTVAVADGAVYYLGLDGVYAFDGSVPVCVSRQLGEKRYVGGVAGGESGKYWLAAKDSAGTWELLVYDTARKLWHKEDGQELVALSRYGGAMMLLRRDGTLVDTSGTYGTKETQVEWSAETGDLGLYTPEHKYLERLELRLELESGAAAEAARPEARVTESTARKLAELERGYQPSEDVAAARAYRDSVAAMQPEDYTSGFEARLQELYDQIAGREAFSYDPEEDEMYKRYARLYAAQGAAAMEDTMGQAAALTGGYGSSYAQAVGQQAYDRYLGELASLVPELRQAALAEYTQEGKALTDRYGLLRQQESAAYDRWQDTVAQWQKALAQAQSEYDDTAAQDAKSYQTMLKHYQDKAEQERKLSAGGAKLEESGYTADTGKESLSSTAAESLQRAVGNYLKSGREDAAQALWQQYAGRMTPVQRQRFEALFAGYGRSAGL